MLEDNWMFLITIKDSKYVVWRRNRDCIRPLTPRAKPCFFMGYTLEMKCMRCDPFTASICPNFESLLQKRRCNFLTVLDDDYDGTDSEP
jgi:hypothetical protein